MSAQTNKPISKGKKQSIYMSEQTNALLQKLSRLDDMSASSIISGAIKQIAIQRYAGVVVSEGAYLALAEGRFDLLDTIVMSNQTTVIVVRESAIKNADGTPGELAKKREDLFAYLDETVVYGVSIEVPEALSDGTPFGRFKTYYFATEELANKYRHERYAQFMSQFPTLDTSNESDTGSIVFLQDGEIISLVTNEYKL